MHNASQPSPSEALPRRRHLSAIHAPRNFEGMVGQSAAFSELVELIERVAQGRSSVFIHGETGTGKELIARAIHAQSPRKGAPFIAVNLSAIPESLLEGELFGYASGAFTGARAGGREGLLDQVRGGTLFLDEIGDLPLPIQVKLLRVIQERTFERLGDGMTRSADFRLITATHKDLPALVEAGSFREDLFYRLNVVTLSAPPLRDRLGDVRLLASHFLEKIAARDGVRVDLSEEAFVELERHSWPGNVRELEHAIDRAVALSRDGDVIGPDRLRPSHHRRSAPGLSLEEALRDGKGLDEVLGDLERTLLTQALRVAGGNLSEVSRRLKVPRQTLQHRLRRHGLS
ncbi:MAG: sigma 54-interacting transcriptional regulator [Myxococcota bacterium]